MERGASLDRITLALAKLKTELVSAEINAKNSLIKNHKNFDNFNFLVSRRLKC